MAKAEKRKQRRKKARGAPKVRGNKLKNTKTRLKYKLAMIDELHLHHDPAFMKVRMLIVNVDDFLTYKTWSERFATMLRIKSVQKRTGISWVWTFMVRTTSELEIIKFE